MEDFRVETSCASPERGQFQGLLSLASFRVLRGPFVGGNLTLTRAALVFFAPLRDIKFSFCAGVWPVRAISKPVPGTRLGEKREPGHDEAGHLYRRGGKGAR